jgi:hypothetical protein
MVQFLSIHFFVGFLQFLLGFSKVTVFLCLPVPKDFFFLFLLTWIINIAKEGALRKHICIETDLSCS